MKLTAFLVLVISSRVMAQSHHGDGGHQRRDHGQPEGAQSRLGEEIKDFSLTDNTGKVFQLTERSKGTLVVLTFWCTTCMSCRQMEKEFDKKAKEYKDKGALFLMVASNSTENADQVNRFLKKNELSFPVLMDSESKIAQYFGSTLTTTTAVIDTHGRLRYYGAFSKADEAVRDLIAGKDVAVPESRPSG